MIELHSISTYNIQQDYSLLVSKEAINCSKVTWRVHYYHCTSTEAPIVASLLKIIIKITYPILQVHTVIIMYTHSRAHTIANIPVSSFKVIGLYVADALRSSVLVNQYCIKQLLKLLAKCFNGLLTCANIRSKSPIS